MAWIGTLILVFHYVASDSESLRGIHRVFKWLALPMGIIQAFFWMIAVTETPQLPQERQALLLFWAVSNIAAFLVIRDAEKKRAEGRKEMSK